MTTYAAIQNPTDWNWKKIINGWRREREMTSYNKMAASILSYNNYEVWPNVLWFYDILDVFSKIIKELTHLLLFYHSELIYMCFLGCFYNIFCKENQIRDGAPLRTSERWCGVAHCPMCKDCPLRMSGTPFSNVNKLLSCKFCFLNYWLDFARKNQQRFCLNGWNKIYSYCYFMYTLPWRVTNLRWIKTNMGFQMPGI